MPGSEEAEFDLVETVATNTPSLTLAFAIAACRIRREEVGGTYGESGVQGYIKPSILFSSLSLLPSSSTLSH
jgi:hypothetical protein